METAKRDQSLLNWSLAYRWFGGKPMRLIPALEDVYRDQHPFIVIQKAAQVFCSEYLINSALWVADTLQGGRGNALYVMPTQVHVNDMSQARFGRAIAESDYLRSRLHPPPPGKGGPARMNLMQFAGYVILRGANNRRQLSSVDADAVFLDEYDLMDEGVLELAQKRLGSSRLGLMRIPPRRATQKPASTACSCSPTATTTIYVAGPADTSNVSSGNAMSIKSAA